MTWMVTGGAGYVGSHVVRALRADGHTVVVVDDFSAGTPGFVPGDVAVVRGSILDPMTLDSAINDFSVTGVVHCAAFKKAGVSVEMPLHTYRQNIAGTLAVLTAMERASVPHLVFSSSASVYGTPKVARVTEDAELAPESPYGESKLVGEWMVRAEVAKPQRAGSVFCATSLRYFNVIGTAYPDVHDNSDENVLPKWFRSIIDGKAPIIYGDDYDTDDGTCVRDYVDVGAVAEAHAAAARRLEAGEPLKPVYNLGSGTGSSVREIADAVVSVSGTHLVPEVGPRRPGDPARIVADGTLAARDLGWTGGGNLHDAVAAAWAAHPKG